MTPEDDLGVVDALAQLSFAVQKALTRRAAERDLSLVQARMLGVLRDRTPSINELAAVLELDKSSVSGLVDRAAARGYVRRVRAEHDGRAVHVQLTARGQRLVGRVADAFADDVDRLTAVLTTTQRQQLSRLATRVAVGR